MTTSLYMTSDNHYIPPKVVAERFKKYFKIDVTIVEYKITHDNHHYTVYFKEPLPTKYMESLETHQYGFLQTREGILYIRPNKPTNLDEYLTKYHHNMVTDEKYVCTMSQDGVETMYKENDDNLEPTTENPFL
jgi:hypothetical protein